MDRDFTLLESYGYGTYGMLRQTLHSDCDLYVVSGSCILGKRVGSVYYLAGSVMYRPVSRNYWLRTIREWSRYVRQGE